MEEQDNAEAHIISAQSHHYRTSDTPPPIHGAHKSSLHVFRRSRRRQRQPSCRELKRMVQLKEVEKETQNGGEEEEEDEREEIERRIQALQRIVPGGESFGLDKLFDETAGYIVALQYQVKTLRALTTFFEKLEKEKTKLGG